MADEEQFTLTMDRVSCVTIIKALRDFSAGLYSGDQAGRILQARADYIRDYLEAVLEQSNNPAPESQKG